MRGRGRGDEPPVIRITFPVRSGMSFSGVKGKGVERRP
jgi:hypothetical protein